MSRQIISQLPSYMSVVDQNLIRGRAVTSPIRLYKMKEVGINQIIDLRNSSFIKSPLEKFFCKFLGIKYRNLKYPHRLEHLPEKKFFDNVINAIKSNTGKTYIHCQYGRRRTGVSVAIYEKKCTKKSNTQILNELILHGFYDLLTPKTNSRQIKYYKILNELIMKYFNKK